MEFGTTKPVTEFSLVSTANHRNRWADLTSDAVGAGAVGPSPSRSCGEVLMICSANQTLDREFWGFVGLDMATDRVVGYDLRLVSPHDGSALDLSTVWSGVDGHWPIASEPTREDRVPLLEAATQ